MKRRKLPKFVSAFTTKAGATRYQFRRKGYARHYFKALPWTDEFQEEYTACMARRKQGGSGALPRGSLSALIAMYYGSGQYQALAPSTKAVYRRILEGLRKKYGTRPVALIERKHIIAMVSEKATTPHAANRLLKMFRLLMSHALDTEQIRVSPTQGVKFLKTSGDGIHTWTEAEVAKYEEAHPGGSQARLAMRLMLYTGQRLSDAIQLGRQHVRGNRIAVKQQKTKARLEISIHPMLAEELAILPLDQLYFLMTQYGKPFSQKGFGNKMRDWCDTAGLPQCSSHGLRKLMAARLAEAGCTAPQIAAVTGHKSLQEVQRYIKAASQKTLQNQAMQAIGGTLGERKLSPVATHGDKKTGKASDIKG